MLEPHPEIGAHRLDFVLPHTLDGGRQLLAILVGDTVERPVERHSRRLERIGREGHAALGGERAHRIGLHPVEQVAARRRVELSDRRHLGARLEPADGRQEELVRARRELLERRGRVGPRREPGGGQRLADAFRHAHHAVGRREAGMPARPPRPERARQTVVQLEEVAGAPARLAAREQAPQRRQVVLDFIDRAGRIVRRRPREPGPRGGRRLALHPLRLRHLARERARHLERVERRHPRARLRLLDARVREVQAPARGPDGEPEQEALAMGPVVLRREGRAQVAPE